MVYSFLRHFSIQLKQTLQTLFIRRERIWTIATLHSQVEAMMYFFQGFGHGFRIVLLAQRHVEMLVAHVQYFLCQLLQLRFLYFVDSRERKSVVDFVFLAMLLFLRHNFCYKCSNKPPNRRKIVSQKAVDGGRGCRTALQRCKKISKPIFL